MSSWFFLLEEKVDINGGDSMKTDWERCVDFHGHECPGLAIGVKASEAARQKLEISFSKDEEVVCVTENDACGVDAIQVLTGCSIGKGNLIYRDTGKNAYSFFVRATGQKLRMVLKPIGKDMDRKERQQYILHSNVEDLFTFSEPSFELPDRARLFSTVICEECNEGAVEHKMRLQDGKKVCLDCFDEYTRGF